MRVVYEALGSNQGPIPFQQRLYIYRAKEISVSISLQWIQIQNQNQPEDQWPESATTLAVQKQTQKEGLPS